MKRRVSIITTCMGRLEHLKQTLPRMIEQAAEVIVVDYSCPQGTAAYVSQHFPDVKLVQVEGQKYFSNWKARNAGAEAATGELLVFCDADTLLGPEAVEWIEANLPPQSFGHFQLQDVTHFNTSQLRLGANQLRGFLAVPAQVFGRAGGYDEFMEGYAGGADTELENRMILMGLERFPLEPGIIEGVIEHADKERIRRHRDPVAVSYAAGYLYRRAKVALMQLRQTPTLPPETCALLYTSARRACASLRRTTDVATLNIVVDDRVIGMPLHIGYRQVDFTMALSVSIKGSDPVAKVAKPKARARRTSRDGSD